MGRYWSSWAHTHDTFSPDQYASLALTHVRYLPDDPLAIPLAVVSLSPILLIVAYSSMLIVRRELTIIFAFIGQLGCEAFNLFLKRTFKQGRPTDFLGTGYGMPSSHSQFVGYFAAFWTLHLLRNLPGASQSARTAGQSGTNGRRSLINVIRLTEHFALLALILAGSIATAYSRYHLSYHTPAQIIVGLSLGIATGAAWFAGCEVLMRRRVFGMSHSLREILLKSPLLIALRIRDSWAVWDDGGIEAEYGLWQQQWDRILQHERTSQTKSSRTKQDVVHMLTALKLASQCDETTTAFSVGCVITDEQTNEVLSTGYSREQPGNTHAEEVALNKLSANDLQQGKEASSTSRTKGRRSMVYLTLYTTMEPCSERLSKKDACVQRILGFNAAGVVQAQTGKQLFIRRIVQGVREPDDFVQCTGTQTLQEHGLHVVHLEQTHGTTLIKKREAGGGAQTLYLQPGWLEREAVRLAKHGHSDQPSTHGDEHRVWQESGWVPLEDTDVTNATRAGMDSISVMQDRQSLGNGNVLRSRGKTG